MSLEKRVVFSAEELRVASPAHECFLECVDQEPFGPSGLYAERLAIDFPQRMGGYERNDQLELWRVRRSCKADKQPHQGELLWGLGVQHRAAAGLGAERQSP
jgi:hypothetical protein